MSLSPRAIALQGIGFGPRLVAVEGLWAYGGVVVTPPAVGFDRETLAGGRPRSWSREVEFKKEVAADFRVQNEAIIMVVVTAVTSGAIQ